MKASILKQTSFAPRVLFVQFKECSIPRGASMRIARANLDGSGVESLVTTGVGTPAGIDLDLVHGKMYWTDNNLGQIRRADPDGTHVETIVTSSAATPLTFPWGIAVDAAGGRIYWVDTAHVWSANLDGSDVVTLSSSISAEYSSIAIYSAIPEPSSAVICLLLVCMLHLSRREHARAA